MYLHLANNTLLVKYIPNYGNSLQLPVGLGFSETCLRPSRAQHTTLGSLFCEIETPTERFILDDSIVKHDVAVEDGQIDTGRKSLPFER